MRNEIQRLEEEDALLEKELNKLKSEPAEPKKPFGLLLIFEFRWYC